MEQLAATTGSLLDQAAEAFKPWRAVKSARSRIPDELWDLACQVAHTHGISKTVRILGLDYCTLRERMGGRGGVQGKSAGTRKIASSWRCRGIRGTAAGNERHPAGRMRIGI